MINIAKSGLFIVILMAPHTTMLQAQNLEVTGNVKTGKTTSSKGFKFKTYSQTTGQFSTIGDNQFRVAGDLTVSIVLTVATHVEVTYALGGYCEAGPRHFVTRLEKDNLPLNGTQSIHGDIMYLTNTGSWAGELQPGTHAFKVSYRTPCAKGYLGQFSNFSSGKITVVVFGDQ